VWSSMRACLAIAVALRLREPPGITAAWYINLDAAHERDAVMARSYAAANVHASRFPAIEPSLEAMAAGGSLHGIHESLSRGVPKYADVEAARGTVGCLASHLELLYHIQASGRPNEVYFLAEDDHVPTDGFADRISEAISYLPDDWDTARLDCWADPETSRLSDLPEVKPNLFVTSIPGCTDEHGKPFDGWPSSNSCMFCGGTSALLVPYEKIPKLIDLWGGKKGTKLLSADCMLTRSDFRNYCLQWDLVERVVSLEQNSTIDVTDEQSASLT